MKQKSIICDLDGTLFDCQWRRCHLPDFEKFQSLHTQDKVIEPTLEILKKFYLDYKIIFVSGRNVKYFETTKEQIKKYFNADFLLYMRPEQDFRHDDILKEEIYNNFIKNDYEVLFVLDDRNIVVKKWRELGLFCLQVAEGNY